MSISRNTVVKILVGVKLLALLVGIVSIFAIAHDQVKLSSSTFPEHAEFLKQREGAATRLSFFLVPLALSVIVDIKELRVKHLENRWYLLTNVILAGYVLVKMFGQTYIGLLVSALMSVALILVIREQSSSHNKFV